jgi:hypothetical protein
VRTKTSLLLSSVHYLARDEIPVALALVAVPVFSQIRAKTSTITWLKMTPELVTVFSQGEDKDLNSFVGEGSHHSLIF